MKILIVFTALPLTLSLNLNVYASLRGGYHSLIINKSGGVYSFADGKHGRLGHGNDGIQYLPKRIDYFVNNRSPALRQFKKIETRVLMIRY